MKPDARNSSPRPLAAVGRAAARRRALMLLAGLLGAGVSAQAAKLPDVNLTVQFRVIEAADATGAPDATPPAAGYSVSTRRDSATTPDLQSLQVSNGRRGLLELSHSTPLQWVQSARIAAPLRFASGVAPRRPAVDAVGGVTWIETGRRIALTPSWPGGRQSVSVELELDASDAPTSTGESPAMNRQHVHTTLTAAIGRWTTFARTGEATDPGGAQSWSTRSSSGSAARWFQLRVLAP